MLKFRRGGRLKCDAELLFGEKYVSFCNEYEYLGLILQTTCAITKHVKKRCLKANIASCLAKNLVLLSLSGAEKYFNTMIKPIALYGIDIIWSELKVSDFKLIDAVKWNFFKKVLGVHKNTRNRHVILITGLPSISEELVRKGFPRTAAFVDYENELEEKLSDVDPELFETCAFTDATWKGPSYSKRNIVLRASTHGFHSVICDRNCHDIYPECICFHCGESASSILHAIKCPVIPSLSFLNNVN